MSPLNKIIAIQHLQGNIWRLFDALIFNIISHIYIFSPPFQIGVPMEIHGRETVSCQCICRSCNDICAISYGLECRTLPLVIIIKISQIWVWYTDGEELEQIRFPGQCGIRNFYL